MDFNEKVKCYQAAQTMQDCLKQTIRNSEEYQEHRYDVVNWVEKDIGDEDLGDSIYGAVDIEFEAVLKNLLGLVSKVSIIEIIKYRAIELYLL